MTDKKLFKIGEIAKQAGVTLRTLRYYDELGLITPTSRTSGNFRLFEENSISIVKLITNLKNLGFSLEEIKELLNSPNSPKENNISVLNHTKKILLAEKEKVNENLIKYQKLFEEINSSLETIDKCFECKKEKEPDAPCQENCKHRLIHIKS